MLKRHLNQAAGPLSQASATSQLGVMLAEITGRPLREIALKRALVVVVLAFAALLAVECRAARLASGNSQEAPGGERPRLIPLVAAESGYSENSSVNLLCTVSQGHHESLQFEWYKDGQLLGSPASSSSLAPTFESHQPTQQLSASQQPQIEKHTDHSLLRIARVQASAHSGRYTCAAKNQFGQDSSSVNLIVNVKLQWIKEPAREIVVSLNQELKVDCLAEGEPKATMRWEKHDALQSTGALISRPSGGRHRQTSTSATGSNHYHIMESLPAGGANRNQLAGGLHYHPAMGHNESPSSSRSSTLTNQEVPLLSTAAVESARPTGSGNLLVSSSRYLTIQRARESDAGVYECIASNGRDADLRKLVHVQVRVAAKVYQNLHIQGERSSASGGSSCIGAQLCACRSCASVPCVRQNAWEKPGSKAACE